MPNNTDWQQFTGLSGAALSISIILGLAVFVIMLIAYTNVISRAGYSRWWILIMLVPLVNIVMLLIFCFKEWPVQRELRELREFRAQASGYGQTGYNAGGYGQPGYPSSGGYSAPGSDYNPPSGGFNPSAGGYNPPSQ